MLPQFTDLSGDISVGVVLPLSGRLASSFGEPMEHGLQLALEEINSGQLGDARIKFIIEDDMSTEEGAVAAFEKLIREDEVSVILGPATSAMTKEAFPIAQENSVVAISPTSAARGLSAIGDYVFRVSLATDVLIPNGINPTYAKRGYERAATMYDEADPFSVDSENALQEGLAGIGVEVLATETFESGATDFSAQLTRIMEVDPQIVFVSSPATGKAWNSNSSAGNRDTHHRTNRSANANCRRCRSRGQRCRRGNDLYRMGERVWQTKKSGVRSELYCETRRRAK